MTDIAKANAVAKRDGLAAEINKALERAEDLRRELKKVDDWLMAWDTFAGRESRRLAGLTLKPFATATQETLVDAVHTHIKATQLCWGLVC